MNVELVPYTHLFYSKVFLNRSSIAARSVSFNCLLFFSVGASFVFLSRFLNNSGITSFVCLLARFLVFFIVFCYLLYFYVLFAFVSFVFICLLFFSLCVSFVFLSRFFNHSGITSFDFLVARFLVLYC